MTRLPILLLIFVGALETGCGAGGYILSGRANNPCIEEISVCPYTGFAECSLNPRSYAERILPGIFNFIAEADAGEDLEVVLVFADQREAGIATQITINEPGCDDSHTFDSDGIDLFAEARDQAVFEFRETMLESGEHLIEIDSDMQAIVLVTVNVYAPQDRPAPGR